MVAFAEAPESVKKGMALHSGRIAGAPPIKGLEAMPLGSGFQDGKVVPADSGKSFIDGRAPGVPSPISRCSRRSPHASPSRPDAARLSLGLLGILR